MLSWPAALSIEPGSARRSDELDSPGAPRVFLALAAVAVPAAGFLAWGLEDFYNPMLPRFVLAGLAGGALVSSFRSATVLRNLRELTWAVAVAGTVWFLYVSYRNGFTTDDVIGLLPLAAGAGSFVSSRLQLGGYLLLVVGSLLAIGQLVEPRFPVGISILLMVVIVLSVGVATLSRRSMAVKLARANAGLEQRVRQRTAELQKSLDQLQEEIVVREAAQEEAAAASLAKSRFLATMSHELRTPLNAILGYAELIGEDLEQLGNDDCNADLERLIGSGHHLLSMIDSILALARVESGQMTPTLVDVELAPLVEMVAAPWSRNRRGNQLRLEVPDDLVVLADPYWLQRVVDSLLSNAIKFTEQGTVTVTGERVGEGVQLAVSDTGIGMPPGAERHIFDRFAQLDPTRTRRHDGAGLGLAIASELVAGMEGRIEVTSTLGEGSTFRVHLPTPREV